jgi:hypothetical protein
VPVHNVHERVLATSLEHVAPLIDGLASPGDRLWPRDRWPAMKLDQALQVGAAGGHGPIRYVVDDYEPGRSVRFRFTAPKGFVGTHGFELEPLDGDRVRIRHTLDMRVEAPARLSWTFVYRPLHDALIEDAFDRVEAQFGGQVRRPRWSGWVRVLRRLLARRRARTTRV